MRRLISGIDGFRAYYLVRADGATVSVNVFDDREGAEESNRIAAQWVRENLPDIEIAPPQIASGETALAF